MRILGIDPGSSVTGFGLIDYSHGRSVLLAAGTLRPRRGHPLAERLRVIGDGMREILLEHRPGSVSIERVFHHANVHSALVLAHIRGVVILEAARAEIPVHEYTALQVKKALVGNGHAGKEQVRAMVLRLLGVRSLPAPHDVSDALALAICHAHSSESQRRRSGG